jgi:hypothetical protein
MKSAFITYIKAIRKQEARKAKQYSFAVAQTVKEARELEESTLVNSR